MGKFGKRSSYTFVARLDFGRVVRCNGEWHWEFNYPLDGQLNSKRRYSHGKCDCEKKAGPSIAVINSALDKLKAEFDAKGMPMTVNHLKEEEAPHA